MSRQFSIPTVLRMVPNRLLKDFFQRLGYGDLGIPWEQLGEREIEPVVKALSGMSRADQDRIEGEMRSVFDLACETGLGAIFEGAVRCGDCKLSEVMPEELGPYGKSMWAWLNRPEAFEKAMLIHQVEHLSWWRKRNDLPRLAPDTSAATRVRLEEEIASLLTREQGRGKVCTVEVLERGETIYFFAYPDDFVQNVTTHDEDGKLAPSTFRATFAIVFAYTPSEGALELYAKLPPKLKQRLEEIFARSVLGQELGPWNPEAAYELDHLKDPSFKLQTDPEDHLRVHISKMRLVPKNSGRRIFVEIDADDPEDSIHRTIEECLNQERLPLSEVWVNLVTFCFEFLPMEGRRPGRLTFDVGFPSSCSLRGARPERVELVEKYLKRWEIDRAGRATDGLATAGDWAAGVVLAGTPGIRSRLGTAAPAGRAAGDDSGRQCLLPGMPVWPAAPRPVYCRQHDARQARLYPLPAVRHRRGGLG